MAKPGKPIRPKARRPKGFEDKSPAVVRAERALISAAVEVYESHGFLPLDTAAFEYADALGKFLPDDDRPNEGVFALQDDDEQWMALRYDLTAPLARHVAENFDALAKPYRRYQFGPVWRNEKPGPGRFREFIQCDADCIGAPAPLADAEIAMLAADVMDRTSLARGEYVVRLNDRRLLDTLLESVGVSGNESQRLTVLRAMDKLDRLGPDGVAALLGDGRKDESGDFTKGAGLTKAAIEAVLAFSTAGAGERTDTLSRLSSLLNGREADEALSDLRAISAILDRLDYGPDRIVIDPAVVRGLGYYTGPVLEVELLFETLNEKGQPARFGSVGGGGRYDDLVARFRGQPAPATGFSFGVTRFAAALAARSDHAERAPVVILSLEKEEAGRYFEMAAQLRRAGIAAEVYVGAGGFPKQMKYADKRGAQLVVIVGEDERKAGQVTIKDLKLGAQLARVIDTREEWREARPAQMTVDNSHWVDEVRARLEG